MHQGLHGMREGILCGTQSMYASGYELADLNDFEVLYDFDYFWENPQLEVNAIFKPRIDNLISQHRLISWNRENQ